MEKLTNSTVTLRLRTSSEVLTPKSQMFAVYGCTTPLKTDYNYVFYLPLTALAWQRVGFRSLVILVGSKAQWLKTPVLRHVLTSLEERHAVVVFLESPAQNAIMLSQVSRLFAASLHKFQDNDYLLTTDSDLWPFHGPLYTLPKGKHVLSLNSKCCGRFEWKGQTYQMLPMGNIGASANTWREIMADGSDVDSGLPTNSKGIVKYFEQTFGDVANETVHKGGNIGWFMDQRMISIRIKEWLDKHGDQWASMVDRNVPKDRIDRASWRIASIASKNDTHLLVGGHKQETWKLIRPLLTQMYGQDSSEHDWCEEYFSLFQHNIT